MKNCLTCGTEFKPNSHTHVYCRKKCRPTGSPEYGRAAYPGLNTSNAGTVSELRVAADLLTKAMMFIERCRRLVGVIW